MAIAADPCEPGVDDRGNARDGERCFGNVGREHDAPASAPFKHAVLFLRSQPRIERQHFDAIASDAGGAPAPPRGSPVRPAGTRACRPVCLAGSRRPHRSPPAVRVPDPVLAHGRAIAQLDGKAASGYFDDRRTVKVTRKLVRIQRRRRDDELEIGPPRQQALQETEQEVDVEAALVCLVQDQRAVAPQQRIAASSARSMPSVISLMRVVGPVRSAKRTW